MFIKPAELANNVELNLNNFNNINDFNHLIDIDPDRKNANLQPNCFNVGPTNILQIPLAENIFPLMHLTYVAFKNNFLNLQLEITADHFRSSVIGICETKMTNEIYTLYNIAGYKIFADNNQSNKRGVPHDIKINIPVMVKPDQTFIRNGIETIFLDLNTPSGIITVGLVHERSVDLMHRKFLHCTCRNNFFS